MKIKIREMLDKNQKTVYWLSKETSITQNNLANLINGTTKSVSFKNIDLICKALNCNVGDILEAE